MNDAVERVVVRLARDHAVAVAVEGAVYAAMVEDHIVERGYGNPVAVGLGDDVCEVMCERGAFKVHLGRMREMVQVLVLDHLDDETV